MRKKHTFLLTIFPSEDEKPGFCGRVQFIATGMAYTFHNMEELQRRIEIEVQQAESQPSRIEELAEISRMGNASRREYPEVP